MVFAELLVGAKQVGGVSFSGMFSSYLETLLVPELPFDRTPKEVEFRGCSSRDIEDSLKEVEVKDTPLVSWSFYLCI